MEFSHLYTYCAVVENGSITKAAKVLFVSQPTVTLKIQELEEHYRVKLLERTNKGVIPTEIGLFVYDEAQKVLAMLDSIQREIETTRNPVEELHVGASSTIGNFALPCTLYLFREQYPNYNILLEIQNATQIMEKILSKRVEIGLVEGPVTELHMEQLTRGGFVSKRIAKTGLVLVAKNNGQFSEMQSIGLEELVKLPLIIREQGSGIRSTIEKVLENQGFQAADLNIVLDLNTINAIVSAVASDIGVSILPKMALRKELRHKILKQIPIDGASFPHDFTLIYSKGSQKQSHFAFVNLMESQERGFC